LVSVSCTDEARTFFRPWVKFYPKTVGDEKKKNVFFFFDQGAQSMKNIIHHGTKNVWAFEARKIFRRRGKEKSLGPQSTKSIWSILALKIFGRSNHEKYFGQSLHYKHLSAHGMKNILSIREIKRFFTSHFTTFGCIYRNSCAQEKSCNVIVSVLVHQIPIPSQCTSL